MLFKSKLHHDFLKTEAQKYFSFLCGCGKGQDDENHFRTPLEDILYHHSANCLTLNELLIADIGVSIFKESKLSESNNPNPKVSLSNDYNMSNTLEDILLKSMKKSQISKIAGSQICSLIISHYKLFGLSRKADYFISSGFINLLRETLASLSNRDPEVKSVSQPSQILLSFPDNLPVFSPYMNDNLQNLFKELLSLTNFDIYCLETIDEVKHFTSQPNLLCDEIDQRMAMQEEAKIYWKNGNYPKNGKLKNTPNEYLIDGKLSELIKAIHENERRWDKNEALLNSEKFKLELEEKIDIVPCNSEYFSIKSILNNQVSEIEWRANILKRLIEGITVKLETGIWEVCDKVQEMIDFKITEEIKRMVNQNRIKSKRASKNFETAKSSYELEYMNKFVKGFISKNRSHQERDKLVRDIKFLENSLKSILKLIQKELHEKFIESELHICYRNSYLNGINKSCDLEDILAAQDTLRKEFIEGRLAKLDQQNSARKAELEGLITKIQYKGSLRLDENFENQRVLDEEIRHCFIGVEKKMIEMSSIEMKELEKMLVNSVFESSRLKTFMRGNLDESWKYFGITNTCDFMSHLTFSLNKFVMTAIPDLTRCIAFHTIHMALERVNDIFKDDEPTNHNSSKELTFKKSDFSTQKSEHTRITSFFKKGISSHIINKDKVLVESNESIAKELEYYKEKIKSYINSKEFLDLKELNCIANKIFLKCWNTFKLEVSDNTMNEISIRKNNLQSIRIKKIKELEKSIPKIKCQLGNLIKKLESDIVGNIFKVYDLNRQKHLNSLPKFNLYISTLFKSIKRNNMYPNLETLKLEIIQCQGFCGGFHSSQHRSDLPHAEYSFYALGSLYLLSCLDTLPATNYRNIKCWLSRRQTKSGGLNGYDGSIPDVFSCHAVVASAKILGISLHSMYNIHSLLIYILSCQDIVSGGFNNVPDKKMKTLYSSSSEQLIKHPTMLLPSLEEYIYHTPLNNHSSNVYLTYVALCTLSMIAYDTPTSNSLLSNISSSGSKTQNAKNISNSYYIIKSLRKELHEIDPVFNIPEYLLTSYKSKKHLQGYINRILKVDGGEFEIYRNL